MKFGVYLEQNMAPGWEEYYLRYKPLKIQLKEIVALNEELATKSADANTGPGIDGRVSLTPPRNLTTMSLSFMPTRPGASGQKGERPVASEATFFEALDEDMKRVGSFVESSLAQLVKRVEELDVDVTEAVR